jgi:hypothetical protein
MDSAIDETGKQKLIPCPLSPSKQSNIAKLEALTPQMR